MTFSVIYQGIRAFAERHSGNEIFINALLVELLLRLEQPDPSESYLEDLLRRITKAAIANFQLHRYAASCKAHSSTAPKSTISGPVRDLYQRASTNEHGIPTQFLQKVAGQSCSLTDEQSKDFTMPFLEQLLPNLDTSCVDAQHCVTSLVSSFITGFVKMEPQKPQDWARPYEIPSEPCNLREGPCTGCSEMNAFLQDATVQNYRISCSGSGHVQSRNHNFQYFKEKREKSTGHPYRNLSKTTKHFEKQHQEWTDRASQAQQTLQKLPQVKLRQCLGNRFNEMIELRAIRIKADKVSGKEPGYTTSSAISPRKRGANNIN